MSILDIFKKSPDDPERIRFIDLRRKIVAKPAQPPADSHPPVKSPTSNAEDVDQAIRGIEQPVAEQAIRTMEQAIQQGEQRVGAQRPANLPAYPFVHGPTTYLRPFKGSLFDAEMLLASATIRIAFFHNPLMQSDASGLILTKTEYETNLVQSQQLANPQEFSITGFQFFIEEGISESDKNLIINTGGFQFRYRGGRSFPMIPLISFPRYAASPIARIVTEGYDAALRSEQEQEQREAQRTPRIRDARDRPQRDPNRPLEISLRTTVSATIGSSAFRIRPTESFEVIVGWPQPITVSRPVRLMAQIVGLDWRPV